MNDPSKFIDLLSRVINKSYQIENKQRTYGTDTILTSTEIHTIAAVGDHPGINITSLANILGITKGAASQMIYKLVKKGVVEKRVSPSSDSEVALSLTIEGQKNYIAHNEYHSQTNHEPIGLLKNMSESSFADLMEFFTAIEKTFDEKLKKN